MQGAQTREGLFSRWARFAVRRRWWVLGAWIVLFLILGAAGAKFRGSSSATFELPGTETQRAFELLKERFPQRAGDTSRLVFRAEQGINDPAVRARIEQTLAEARTLPSVVSVGSPFEPGSGAVSPGGQIAYAELQYRALAPELDIADLKALLAFVDRQSGPGLRVEVGGNAVESAERLPPGKSEAIGIVAAIFILLVAFGSVVAMGLPLATALVGLGVSFALMGIAANWLDLPIFANAFAAMIGLGVGIDYALFIVTRYREGLAEGRSPEDAVVRALTTAGRAVAFAGGVVVIALLGMMANGIPFVASLGIAGAIVVVLAVLVALTLLPALLGFAGHTIDRWRLPMFHATDTGAQTSVWYRLARAIQRRPLLWFGASLALLVVMALPTLRVNLGFSDAGTADEALHSRRAYDLLAEGFGPGFNGPLLVVLDLRAAGPAAVGRLDGVRERIAQQPGVAFVTPPIPNPAQDTALLTVFPAFAPQDKATERLTRTLRTEALPAALAGTGVTGAVTGPTAAFIDMTERLLQRLPWFFGAVLGLSFLLLVAVFRSIVVPLKAAIMNLLSIGAAFGVLVAIFQWGWGASLLGVEPGPIEPFLPMFLFAILFGLSMDYEVFLISRIREEYLRTGESGAAVAHGLAVTARVITAAAAIMVAVFLSFVLDPGRTIKEFGVGLATAILIDATVVRLVLVPATMELLGNGNWWLPAWLDRLLPNLDVEGEGDARHARAPAPSGVAAD